MLQVTVRIGFLPSYRFRFSDWCRRMYDDSVSVLRALDGVELVVPRVAAGGAEPADGATPHGAVHSLDEAESVADYFAAEKVDGLVICPLDFGDERSAAKVAQKLRVPVLLYATKEPPAQTDASLARVSDSYCGNLALAAALYRRKLPFHFAGIFMPDEPDLRAELDAFVRAAAVVKGLMGARIGQVGLRPEAFESCEFSEREMIRKFRQNLICRDLSRITAAADQIGDDDPAAVELVDEVRAGVADVHVSEEHLRRAARLELALMRFWESNRLSAMAVQCWSGIQQLMGISVCALFGRLTARGMLTACEVDVLGALTMLIQTRAALGVTIPHFIDWTIQHRDDPGRFLAWHCGNAPVCLAASPERTALRSRGDMVGERPIGELHPMEGLYEFQLKPGPVTLCRLAEYDGRWKLLIAPGEAEESDERLAGTWAWVRVPDHQRLYRALVEEGFIHHASMIHGDQRAALRLACRFLDVDPVVVE
jgi:L-fucose isomerase-like protein